MTTAVGVALASPALADTANVDDLSMPAAAAKEPQTNEVCTTFTVSLLSLYLYYYTIHPITRLFAEVLQPTNLKDILLLGGNERRAAEAFLCSESISIPTLATPLYIYVFENRCT